MPTKAELETTITELKRTNNLLLKRINELTEDFNEHLETVQETIDLQYEQSELYKQITKKSENKTYETYNIAAYLLQKNNEYKNKYRKRETTNSKNTGAVWDIITKHFNDILVERDIPNKSVKHGEKKEIRRKANNKAKLEKLYIKNYSDDKLGRELKFPEVEDWSSLNVLGA